MCDYDKEIDFRPFGKALKKARTQKKLSRNVVANMTGLSPRYIAEIENRGQRPSMQTFYMLVMICEISVDALFFPDKVVDKTTERRQLDSLLDELDNKDLEIIIATASATLKARSKED